MVKTNALKGRQCRFIYVDGTRSSASDDNPNCFLKLWSFLPVALFTFNALMPETYAALLRFADWGQLPGTSRKVTWNKHD
jgi:hypothetical protein